MGTTSRPLYHNHTHIFILLLLLVFVFSRVHIIIYRFNKYIYIIRIRICCDYVSGSTCSSGACLLCATYLLRICQSIRSYFSVLSRPVRAIVDPHGEWIGGCVEIWKIESTPQLNAVIMKRCLSFLSAQRDIFIHGRCDLIRQSHTVAERRDSKTLSNVVTDFSNGSLSILNNNSHGLFRWIKSTTTTMPMTTKTAKLNERDKWASAAVNQIHIQHTQMLILCHLCHNIENKHEHILKTEEGTIKEKESIMSVIIVNCFPSLSVMKKQQQQQYKKKRNAKMLRLRIE